MFPSVWLAFAAGLLLTLATGYTVVGALVVPRAVRGIVPYLVAKVTIAAFQSLARLSDQYVTRDRILSFQAPTYLIALLAVWIAMFVTGFALMYLPFVPDHTLGEAFRVSGSSFFTLGFASETGTASLLTFFAAATGLIVVALQIAYLPVIYGAFNRRETLVTMLDSRAGVPAWGPEVLARAELVDNVGNLDTLYARWEEWTADLAETHTTYPVLIWMRSPNALRSWVRGLLAVLDAASLHLATRPLTAPATARVMIRMGYVTLREIATTLGLPVNDDPKPDDPIELTREDFEEALHLLAHAGWPMEREPDEAWTHFRGWRVNYEAMAYAIADAVDAPPALWSGRRHRLPEAMQPPRRPPHRTPTEQTIAIAEETRRRREARGEQASGDALSLSPFHEHDHDLHDDGETDTGVHPG